VKLWNRELFDQISHHFEGELTSANVISRLKFYLETELDFVD
jgi:hypothetical protein